MVLADAMAVEVAFDVDGLGNGLDGSGGWFARFGCQFFIEDVFAKNDAVIADVNAGAGDQLFNFGMRFSAEAAESDVGRSGHNDRILD